MRFTYMIFVLLHLSIGQFFLSDVLSDVYRPFWHPATNSADCNCIPEKRLEHAIRMNEAYRVRRLQLLSDWGGK